jgi:hypothetical protein
MPGKLQNKKLGNFSPPLLFFSFSKGKEEQMKKMLLHLQDGCLVKGEKGVYIDEFWGVEVGCKGFCWLHASSSSPGCVNCWVCMPAALVRPSEPHQSASWCR